jgi:hypothetical protein
MLMCVCIRAEQVLRLVCQREPVLSVADKKLLRDVKEFKEKLGVFQKSLEQMKAKQNYYKVQVCYMSFILHN